jgi:transcriptional regulator with XRE-family HTH domain
MAIGASDVREIVERVCARPDVLEACGRRDLGVVIEVLGAHGVTQGQLAGLTGISQGRLSEYRNHKRKPTASSIFEAFAGGLGMPPTARRALGLSPDPAVASVTALPGLPSPAVGLVYPSTPVEASENLARLWRADLSGVPLLRARLDPIAWSDASLRWLIDRGRQQDSEIAHGIRVGMSDVDRFRTTAKLFTQLDDRFGGGHARQALIQYLSTDAERLLHGRFSDNVGSALFSATAEATLLAAWMTYDSTPDSSLAQRYFIQALALAQAGDDRLLGASILDAMSHQATYTGRFDEAANLAGAAMTGTQGIATPTLTAHFHTMEARALARLGDAKGCDRSLAEAVREFERRNPDDDPAWIRYFDESELSAEFGHCLRDLGRATDAVQYASRSLVAVDETTFMRSDFFAMMVLADSYLDAGDREQACSIALNALAAGEQIRSARCVKYLSEFHQRLTTGGISRSAVEFNEQAARSRLWRIATRPSESAA